MVKTIKPQSNEGFTGILNHISENIWLYLLCLIFLCTGVVLGFYNVKYMPSTDKSSIVNWIESSLNIIKQENVSKTSILMGSISNYIPVVIALWFLGMTIIGIPIVLVLDLLKGYALGFSFSFIINNFGVKGIWVGIGTVLLQNLIFVPCVIILSVYAMEFSINILKNKLHNGVLSSILGYSLRFIIIFLVMFIGFLIEAYISPNVLNYLGNALGYVA
ncbi:stage II sporulation protein M [Hathewaya histolytica]|uniref:Stage II sporulation protein M n=1 Tax=Hathewaya histolytica TaxID=1498 RepID=A0A4U9RAX1_HATHI|nr:stage II sporulation protein M [Hathewaya histolytica]VTQ88286.1 stage II sporulation protein M [Hathewaya histolytica]